ncbi:MAG: type II and III secretion system protein family protein [Beijerinckiaceae bacterium]|nr:type II and III secretion system protein family protein [Beijerinckiaceae bacterium]
MNPRFTARCLRILPVFALAIATCLVLPRDAALAQAPSTKSFESKIVSNPKIVTSGEDQTSARRIELQVGKSIIIDLPRDASEIFVANPAVANAVVKSSRKVYVIGVTTGTTSIFINDSEGKQIAVLDMSIARELGRELSILRDLMKTTFPRANIEVKSVGVSFVLSGTVDSALDAQRAVDIATSLTAGIQSTESAAANTGLSKGSETQQGKVINALHIRGRDQVMIKVTVAEVQKTVLKHLGVDLNGQWKVGSSVFDLATTGLDTTGKTVNFNRTGSSNSTATIRALEQQGAFHTLAEPTLTAISGESAKFLAGGEIPILSRSFTNGAFQDTILYKPVGVSLAFTPIVLSEGRISLRVSTEVAERDDANSVVSAGINIPGFKTRRTETTVELPSGASLATAGLIQQRSAVNTNALPGISNIPIIGALARSREFQKNETELLIIVSPFIVKPAEPRDIPRPDDGFSDATDPAGYFLGRVNRLYGVTGAERNTGSYRGNFGFITE